jgi:cholesterol transport system auxiliary component
MMKGRAGAGPDRRPLPLLLFVVLVGIAVSGCAGPPKREYVLGAAAASQPASAVQTALPVVQIERVLLPDYLDTRDILTRRDRQVVPSESARWAERLSVAVARALATSIATQLTGVVVTSAQPVDPPVLRVLVDVIDFELTGDRQVVLAARWTITDGTRQRSLAVEQATLTEPVAAAGGDSAVVAAMSLALEKLANRISAGIERNLDRGRRPRLAFTSKPVATAIPFCDPSDGGFICLPGLLYPIAE